MIMGSMGAQEALRLPMCKGLNLWGSGGLWAILSFILLKKKMYMYIRYS